MSHLYELSLCPDCHRFHTGWTRTTGKDYRSRYPSSQFPDYWVSEHDREGIIALPPQTYLVDHDGDVWCLKGKAPNAEGDIPAALHSNNVIYTCDSYDEFINTPDHSLSMGYGPFLVVHYGAPPLDVPKFASLAEAEAWLEAHA